MVSADYSLIYWCLYATLIYGRRWLVGIPDFYDKWFGSSLWFLVGYTFMGGGQIMKQYTEDELRKWYPVKCTECNWKGLSRDCAGGLQIADTGDYDDIYCPRCWGYIEEWRGK